MPRAYCVHSILLMPPPESLKTELCTSETPRHINGALNWLCGSTHQLVRDPLRTPLRMRAPQLTHPRLHLPATCFGLDRGRCDLSPKPANPASRYLATHECADWRDTPISTATSVHARAVQHRSIPLLDNKQRHQRQSRPHAPKPITASGRHASPATHARQASPETGHAHAIE
jgi:hypothetical protein